MDNPYFDDFDMAVRDDREAIKDLLTLKFLQRCKKMGRRGEKYIYDEQEKYATQIIDAFKNDIHLSTFVAPVQWGKTGVIISLLHQCCTDENFFINPNNILILTGMNDNEWKQQTRSRLIKELRPSVHHLHGVMNLKLNDNFRDALIIIDECQIANQEHQTIRKMFVRNNLHKLEFLKERNIRIVQTSATPDNVLVDCLEYKEEEHFTCIVDLDMDDTSRSYKFFSDIKEENLKESMDLKCLPNVEKLFKDICSFKKARWHIVRVPSCKSNSDNATINNIQICANKFNCDVKFHMMNLTLDEDEEPEQVIAKRPSSGKHTVILVKNKWRASKSFTDKYIGVVHDRFTNNKQQFATEVQSLAGRMVGHGKMKSKYPPIIYCQLRCIYQYIALFNNRFDYDDTTSWKKSNKPSYMNKDLPDEEN